MPRDRTPMRAQRLALVFRGAGTTWALPAASVLEVLAAPRAERVPELAPEREGEGTEVEEFCGLFGEEPPPANGREVALVLDSTPPRALRIDGVVEVADLAAASYFRLPAGLPPAIGTLVRGAVLHCGRLVLEADAEALARFQPSARTAPVELAPGPALEAGRRPVRALVFEVGDGELYGISLAVSAGVLRIGTLCPVPLAPPGLLGIVEHEGSILRIYDLSAVAGLPPTRAELAIALEVGGSPVGVVARRVVGVMEGFDGDWEPQPGGVSLQAPDGRRVFFPEFESWLPPAEVS